MLKTLFFLAITGILFTSCKDEYTICNLSKNVSFVGGFYKKSGSADVPTSVSYVTMYLLDGGGGPIFSNSTLQSFSLPLNPVLDSSRYVIILNSNPVDTLTIVYKTQTVNLSPECGNIFNHTITKLYSTKHTLDSARLVNPTINTNPLENGRIYF